MYTNATVYLPEDRVLFEQYYKIQFCFVHCVYFTYCIRVVIIIVRFAEYFAESFCFQVILSVLAAGLSYLLWCPSVALSLLSDICLKTKIAQ